MPRPTVREAATVTQARIAKLETQRNLVSALLLQVTDLENQVIAQTGQKPQESAVESVRAALRMTEFQIAYWINTLPCEPLLDLLGDAAYREYAARHELTPRFQLERVPDSHQATSWSYPLPLPENALATALREGPGHIPARTVITKTFERYQGERGLVELVYAPEVERIYVHYLVWRGVDHAETV